MICVLMRIKSVRILIIIFMMLLTGCTISGLFNYEYEYFNNNIGNLVEKNDSGIYVIKNIEDVNSFKNNNEFNNNFVQNLDKYDEDFFNNEYLLVIVLYDKTGNTEYRPKNSYTENGILTIEIKEITNNISDDSLINKAFIIEIDNREQYLEIKTKIIK